MKKPQRAASNDDIKRTFYWQARSPRPLYNPFPPAIASHPFMPAHPFLPDAPQPFLTIPQRTELLDGQSIPPAKLAQIRRSVFVLNNCGHKAEKLSIKRGRA